MVKIEFNDRQISVPESWEEISLGNYEKWFMRDLEDQMAYVGLVADICGVETDFLMESPRQLFDAIVRTIDFVFDPQFEPSPKVSIDGRYFFVSLSDKLTLGEWVDIEATLGSDSHTKVSEVLAIVCRPAGEDYNADTAAARKEIFRRLSCDKVMPVLAFFLHRKKESEAILNHYSQVVDQAARFLQDTKTFVINGGGIKLLPIWQRIRYIYLTRSLEKQLSKFLGSSSIEATKHVPKKTSTSLKNRLKGLK